MIYRCRHLYLDMSQVCAVTELQDSAVYRRFAVYMSNGDLVHKYECRVNTSDSVDMSREHRALLESWSAYQATVRTWTIQGEAFLIHRLRNFNIALTFITGVSTLTSLGDLRSFDVYLKGRPDAITVKTDQPAKYSGLVAEHKALLKAWAKLRKMIIDHRQQPAEISYP